MGRHRSIVYLLIGISIFLGSGCGKEKIDSSPAPTRPKDVPELEMDRVDLTSYVDALVSWHLKAPRAQAYTSLQYMKADDMEMTFYKAGEKSTFLSSSEGYIKTESGSKSTDRPPPSFSMGKEFEPGDMYLEGDVVVISTEGVRMETDWLWYHKKDELITSTAPVKVIRSDSITTGVGMEATSDMSEIKIFDQTVVIRDTSDENP